MYRSYTINAYCYDQRLSSFWTSTIRSRKTCRVFMTNSRLQRQLMMPCLRKVTNALVRYRTHIRNSLLMLVKLRLMHIPSSRKVLPRKASESLLCLGQAQRAEYVLFLQVSWTATTQPSSWPATTGACGTARRIVSCSTGRPRSNTIRRCPKRQSGT